MSNSTFEQRSFIVKTFYKNCSSATATRRKFDSVCGTRNGMANSTTTDFIRKIEELGTVHDMRNGNVGSSEIVTTKENIT
ncbi:hypothetical protein TNCV_3965281 [Trichonephila clavipes]|nr:hypothetical protein TNCV_3965281 [Trichonephila clavipes]